MLNSGGCAPDSHQLADQCVLGQDGLDGRLQRPRSTLRRLSRVTPEPESPYFRLRYFDDRF